MIAELNKKDILNYCEKYSADDSSLQKELIDYTFKHDPAPQMISGLQVGNILQSLIMISNSKNILEVGMFTGYSALKMAEILPEDGIIHTCEISDNHINTAQKFFKKSGLQNKIKIHAGPALDTINNFKINSFDFCFIDADKNNYTNYYMKCIKLLKPKGIMIIDNMLWGGKVLKPTDKETKIIANTAKIINDDINIYNTMLSIRDGLMLCIKK